MWYAFPLPPTQASDGKLRAFYVWLPLDLTVDDVEFILKWLALCGPNMVTTKTSDRKEEEG